MGKGSNKTWNIYSTYMAQSTVCWYLYTPSPPSPHPHPHPTPYPIFTHSMYKVHKLYMIEAWYVTNEWYVLLPSHRYSNCSSDRLKSCLVRTSYQITDQGHAWAINFDIPQDKCKWWDMYCLISSMPISHLSRQCVYINSRNQDLIRITTE